MPVETATDEPAADPARRPTWLERFDAFLDRQDPPRQVLALMVVTWALLFIALGRNRHEHFATFGFDLGIYDQALWKLSRFHNPFITVRGLNFFGHHLNPALLGLVPFYWLRAGPVFLLVVQCAVQASGAVAIFLLARDRLADRWLAVALGAVLLLHPTYQYLTWEWFHPDALAISPLLFAYWAARAKRWRWFALAAVLAVACKEDVALPMIVIGVLIAFRGNRRVGAITVGLATAWYGLVTRVILPQVNHGLPVFYDQMFGEFGNGPIEVVKNVIFHPGRAYRTITEDSRLSFYRMMLGPLAFLPIIALPTFLIAMPMLATDTFTTFPYAREIRYHYAALVLAGCILAAVEAVAMLSRGNKGMQRFLVGLLVATSFAGTVAWGPSPVSVKYHSGLWPMGPDPRLAAKQAAVRIVPARAPASVTYYFTPHMTHRDKVYEWPEPWKRVNWGVMGERMHDPGGVDWVVLDRQVLSDTDRALLRYLIDDGELRLVFDDSGIIVLKRVARGGRVDVTRLKPISRGADDAP